MSLWLIGLIILLAILSLVEGGIILSMQASGNSQGLVSRIIPRNWLSTPKTAGKQLALDNRIVLLDSAQDIALIHDRINHLFSALHGFPAGAANLARPCFSSRTSATAPSPERLVQLQSEIDRIFEGIFNDQDIFSLPGRLEHGWNMSEVSSAMQIADQGSNILVQLDLPDVDASAIAITLQGRLLTIAVNQNKNQPPRQDGGLDSGYALHNYEETKLMLPEPVNADAAQASYRNGILRIEIPKSVAKEPLARTIKLI